MRHGGAVESEPALLVTSALMPSPLGHALGGVIAGGAFADSGTTGARRGWRDAAAYALLGVAPDLDFLIGAHRHQVHSLGAALIVGAIAGGVMMMRPGLGGAAGARLRLALAVAAAYGSHVLLDAVSLDTTPPLGAMVFWPLSSDFYQSPISLFMAISRRYWLPGFLVQNLTALAWELVLLGPLATLVWLRRFRRRSPSEFTEATS